MKDNEIKNEMVERVARAIAEAHSPMPWAHLEEDERACHEHEARAAIAAMREPTEEMIDRALIVNLKPSQDRSCSTYLYDEEAREIWQQQIDAALHFEFEKGHA